MGGSRAKNPSCGAYQDNIPPLARTTDEDGCPAYVIVGQGGTPVPYANDCPKRDASSDATSD
ncbi:MAG: hypothetical protein KF819_05815 [Labilithrix sp.]|nr:hypothetical protein [Labilithrix sp.]